MNIVPFLLFVAQDAPTGETPAKSPSFFELGGSFIPLILIFGVFWLLVLRPESKQRKKRQQMLAELKKGDRVVTTGGMYGKVVQIQDQVVTLEVADGVRMRFALSAMQSVETDDAPTSERTADAKG